MTCCSIVFNLFAFVNLIEKYDKAILFLNLSIIIPVLYFLYHIVVRIADRGFNGIFSFFYFKAFVVSLIIMVIINKYKVKKVATYNEIEEIGKHKE